MAEIKWISVKDKLPKDFENQCGYEFVLVYGEEESGCTLFSIAQQQNGKWNILANAGATTCEGFLDMTSEDVTHWASLPYPDQD